MSRLVTSSFAKFHIPVRLRRLANLILNLTHDNEKHPRFRSRANLSHNCSDEDRGPLRVGEESHSNSAKKSKFRTTLSIMAISATKGFDKVGNQSPPGRMAIA